MYDGISRGAIITWMGWSNCEDSKRAGGGAENRRTGTASGDNKEHLKGICAAPKGRAVRERTGSMQ